jgi:PPOX class probable F420-dependent enzyme
MSFANRIAALMDPVYLRIRHRDAWRVEGGGSLDGLKGHKYCLLVTYRRSGEAVPTPVWFGIEGGRLYVRSGAWAGKLKRIRSNPKVQVAPCDFRGKPLGSAIEAAATIVPSAEEEKAEAALRSNYGLGRRLYEGPLGPMGVDTAYIEIAPIGGSA